MVRFEGRVAVVTGGAHGIGGATAELFGREGASVVVVDLEPGPAAERAHSIADAGGKALAFSCDVRNPDSAEGAIKSAIDAYGRLDVLVCCAGVTRDNLVFKMSDSDWAIVLDTHLTGSFYFARAAQSVMTKQSYGKIVLVSSVAALGNRGQANYSAAKAGLQGMTRTLAIELGRFNINVNAVAPGFIETRMTEATARRLGVSFDQYKESAGRSIALQRIGQPRDVANVIAFLSSDDSSFVSGETIYVAGGPVGF